MKRAPSVLWIVSDHQVHATRPPGFDGFPLQRRLARLGTEFTRALSVLPICSPARASMLTGLYPHAHGLTENDGRFGGREGLDCGDWMVHRPFQAAGYRCGWFGKWHLDNRHPARDYGFEGFSLPGYGHPYGCAEYRDYLRREGLPDPAARVVIPNETALAPGSGIEPIRDRAWFDCVSGVARLDGPASLHEAYFVTALAVRWLESLRGETFFLRVDPWGPHPPYLLAEPFLGMLDRQAIELPPSFHCDLSQRPEHHRAYRDYWSSALGLDAEQWRRQYQHALEHVVLVETALADLLDHVDLDHTLVIFNSDHGDAVGSSGGVANKGDLMTEATMQIPLCLAGCDLPAGNRCDRLVSNLDIAPTLLELCGVDSGQHFHGLSMAPLLRGGAADWRRGFMAQHFGLHQPIAQRAWYREQLKLVIGQGGFRELYDLSRDPAEMENLAIDAAHLDRRMSMERELLEAMRAVDDRDQRVLGELGQRAGGYRR